MHLIDRHFCGNWEVVIQGVKTFLYILCFNFILKVSEDSIGPLHLLLLFFLDLVHHLTFRTKHNVSELFVSVSRWKVRIEEESTDVSTYWPLGLELSR